MQRIGLIARLLVEQTKRLMEANGVRRAVEAANDNGVRRAARRAGVSVPEYPERVPPSSSLTLAKAEPAKIVKGDCPTPSAFK